MQRYRREIEKIVNASRNKALTFFVGAGISRLSNAPTWKELICHIGERLSINIKDDLSTDDYLKYAQIFYYQLNNENQYYDFLNETLQVKDLEPNEIHHRIYKLNPTNIVTTNFDNLLEKAALQNQKYYKKINCDKKVPEINGSNYILKIHGDLDGRNIVFKEEDYLNYSESFKLIETLMKSIFSTNLVVFIGYSLSDYNIKLILNWSKSLLGDNFNKPIFISTDEAVLKEIELKFYESRGLSVIETARIATDKDYLSRYRSVFDLIDSFVNNSLEGKNEDEAFDMLYELLLPLDRLNTLRAQDIAFKIEAFNSTIARNTLNIEPKSMIIYSKFNRLNQMDDDSLMKLSDEVLSKYHTILRVFSKANITYVASKHDVYKSINGTNYSMAGEECFTFDYMKMKDYVRSEQSDLMGLMKRGFYLTKLKKLELALECFIDIAKKSFIQKDYLIYYLAQTNCKILKNLLNNRMQNRDGDTFENDSNKSVILSEYEYTKLFDELPISFQLDYPGLKELGTYKMLYRWSHDNNVYGHKLIDNLNRGTRELGFTTTDKVISTFNNNINFIVGNNIILDYYTEFRDIVRSYMDTILYKYVLQNQTSLMYTHDYGFSEVDKIQLDEIDFYFLVTGFNKKELILLLSKNGVEELKFKEIGKIEMAIKSVMSYYRSLLIDKNDRMAIEEIELQFYNCLTLLRYMEVSQVIIDDICKFIMGEGYLDEYIEDYVLLLDRQVHKRQMHSDNVKKAIQDRVVNNLANDIATLKKGSKLNRQKMTKYTHAALITYVDPFAKNHEMKLISNKISSIIRLELEDLYPDLSTFYCLYATKYMRTKLRNWAYDNLNIEFKLEMFNILMKLEYHPKEEACLKLREYISNYLNNQRVKKNGTCSNQMLLSVALLISKGKLQRKYFECFLGYSNEFDFYYQLDKFDFSRFNVKWLFKLKRVDDFKPLTNNASLKNKIQKQIINELKNPSIDNKSKNKLLNLLTEYFS